MGRGTITKQIKYTAICLATIVFIYAGLSVFGAFRIMELPRLPLKDSPASVGLTYEDVSFPSRGDRVTLRGWYIPAANQIVIVIVHGGFQNRVDDNVGTLQLARDLVDRGYNILLFDLRGRGESDGKGLALLNTELDIGGAVDYLTSRGYPQENIVLMGFCAGAASACIFSSQENPGAVILDGCFPDIPDRITSEAVAAGVPGYLVELFLPGLHLMVKAIYDYEPVNPVDIVADIACPIFFIHEELDKYTSLEDTYQLYQKSGNPADEIWEVSAAEHSQAYTTHPAEYVARLDKFLTNRLYASPD